jgi:O-antigen ligase
MLGLVFFSALAPGILGTLRNFVFAGTNDDSITGRLDDYQFIPGLMDGHWWFGRGFATFEPTVYFFLDNQYLMSLITGGVVGLIAFMSIILVGASVARGARKRFTRTPDRDLAQAIAAGIVGAGAAGATLDLLSFLQATFVLFLLGGCGAALWTIARHAPAQESPAIGGTKAAVEATRAARDNVTPPEMATTVSAREPAVRPPERGSLVLAELTRRPTEARRTADVPYGQ